MDDRPPPGFELVERIPGSAGSAPGGPYRSGWSTPRLPWVSIQWPGGDVLQKGEAIAIGGLIAFTGAMLATHHSTGWLLVIGGAAVASMSRTIATQMKITITDRFISASHGLFRQGNRFEISALREIVLLAPGSYLTEHPLREWWLAVRGRDGEVHLLASIEDETHARWLHGRVERLFAERVELRCIGGVRASETNPSLRASRKA